MKITAATALTTALGLAQVSNGIKILMNNDDGFGGGNIRELYRLLKEAGHDGKLPPLHQRGQLKQTC
jgi:5'-nucleotidase